MMKRSVVIEPGKGLTGQLRMPGDKSISHRALLFSLVGEGSALVTNLSPAADVAATALAAQTLTGIDYKARLEDSLSSAITRYREIPVDGGADRLNTPHQAIDVANSGTTIRLLAGILAGSRIEATLTGDASIRRRPMGRVVDPLKAMGADIEVAEGGLAPLTIRGRPLKGADHVLPVASAQVKGALLLAGMSAEGVTAVQEPSRSRDHTERMLRHMGVPVEEARNRLIVKSIKLSLRDIDIPGDISSSAPLLAAAAVLPASDLLIRDVGLNPTRTGFLEILRRFGAQLQVSQVHELSGEPRGDVRIVAGDRRPLEVSGEEVAGAIDELPLVAVLGAFAEGETVVHGAAELRVKESDRIDAICRALRRLGVDITELPDGFVVRGRGGGLTGGSVDAHGDHRIAMAAAVTALAAEESVLIDGWDSIAVSYPSFGDDLDALVIR